MAEKDETKKPKGARRGPKPDKRPSVTFKVQQNVYETLAALQPTTGMKPDDTAGLLLHLMVNDPANAVARLEALLRPVPANATDADTGSTPRRLDVSRQRP